MKQTTVLLFLLVLVGIAQADSLNVRFIGGCSTLDRAMDPAVCGDYAYVADLDAGLCVISVANPANPTKVGQLGTPDRAWAVAVDAGYAYLAAGDSGLLVISVADPARPTAVGHYVTPGIAFGVAVAGSLAFVASLSSGLRIVSVADPAHPVEVGHCDTPGQAKDVAIAGDYAYVAADTAGLRVISVADPANPVEIGYCSGWWTALSVAVSGEFASIASYQGGLHVVSVADPVHPTEVGSFGFVLAQGVAAAGDVVYAAAAVEGLRVFSIADPASPAAVGYHDLPGTANNVVRVGHYEYVAAMTGGLQILQYYGGALGDLDIDDDSLRAFNDTIHLRRARTPGPYVDYALGEFVLANTSEGYNPDSGDGPSTSPLESLSYTGSLAGPGGTIDSILVLNLPGSLAQGQAIVCTLAVYAPQSLPAGDYSGPIVVAGFDSLHYPAADTVYAFFTRLGDLDVDGDSLDVVRDTIRVRPRLAAAGPPPTYTACAIGEFVLANTNVAYNPDTTDGPSRSRVDSLSVVGSLSGPGGTLDSVFVPDMPVALARGQVVECTLAVYMPPGLEDGDYAGPITIAGIDSGGSLIDVSFCALISKATLGDLDVDDDSLDVAHDTMNLHAQPAGPVYSPYAKAEFMLVNTRFYNPDIEDGPSHSPFYVTGYSAYLSSPQDTVDSIYVLNLPESLAAGQTVECTLALVVPVGTSLDDYLGLVTIDAYDTVGYRVRDSFFLTVRGPEPRQSLDSLRVAPIPFKPNQNPEHDAIHFQGLMSGARVVVYDASGQSVWSATESGDGHLAWKAEVASGIYVYLVVSADGKASKVGKLSVIR